MSFRRLYPNRESLTFDGGLNTKYAKALIPDNESPDCANVVFSNGAVETREGAVKLNTATAGSAAFDGIYVRRDNTNAESMCVFIDTHMKVLATTTFITVPSAQSIFTAGNRVCADMAENYLFIGNGGITPHKWDGTLFTQHGVPEPLTAPTGSTNGAAGNLSASIAYQWVLTYVNSALVESDYGPLSATHVVSGTSGQADVTLSIAPTSAGVARRRLYRNKAAAQSTFYRVTEIADNTTATYTDNIAETALGVQAPTDNGVPPKYSAITYFRGRLFVNDPANPNYVWYSTVDSPYTFPSTNFFKIGNKTSDLVKGFGTYDNALLILCDEGPWLNYMPDPSNDSSWKQVRANSPYGSKSPFGVVTLQDKVFYPAVEATKFVGFAALKSNGVESSLDASSSQLTVTTAVGLLQSERIEPDMFNVTRSLIANISATSFKNKIYITLPYGSSATRNNRIYVYDYSSSNVSKKQTSSWVPWTGLSAQQFCIYGGKLYFASSTNSGFVYQLSDTSVYADDGSAIDSYYWTKEFSGFEPETTFMKDFRYVNLLVDNAGAYYMNLTYKVDSDSGSGSSVQINLNPGSSLWGSMVWGVNTWGGGSNQTDNRVYLGSLRGKRVQFKFSNQNVASQRFKVHVGNFSYNIRGVSR